MGKINPWLVERLGIHNAPAPTLVNVILEVEPERLEELQTELGRLGIRVKTARISFGRYIPAAVPTELLVQVAGLPGVLKVDKNMPVTVRLMNPLQDLLGAVISPVSRVIPTLPAPTFTDEILGQVRMSQVEIPGMPALGPAGILFGLLPPKRPDVNIIPTGVVRESLKVPEDNMIGLVVGLIDTGVTPTHPQFNPLNTRIEGLSVTGEPFIDGLGHGMWVSTAAFGGPFQTPFGMCRGIASPDAGRGGKIVHVKALSNLGAGTTDGIMKAIEICLERGCKVISMSLGCLPSSAVVLGNPHPKTMQDIAEGDTVLSYEGGLVRSGPKGGYRHEAKLVRHKVLRKIHSGRKMVYSLRTRTRTLRASGNHPVLTLRRSGKLPNLELLTHATELRGQGMTRGQIASQLGISVNTIKGWLYKGSIPRHQYGLEWTPVETLKKGDYVVVATNVALEGKDAPTGLPSPFPSVWDADLAWVVGLYTGDGSLDKDGEVIFSLPPDDPAVPVLKYICDKWNIHYWQGDIRVILFSKPLQAFLQEVGATGYALTKRVPGCVYELPKACRLGFIRGLLAADGNGEASAQRIKTPNRSLLVDLHHLCITSGVWVSNVNGPHGGGPHEIEGIPCNTQPSYDLRVTFQPKVRHVGRNSWHGVHVDTRTDEFYLDMVTGVAPEGEEDVYDIEVEGAHTFVADGMVVHNSELQGGVDQDPLCRLITQYQNSAVFVCAAGNSGPDPYTISSPAASPGALCVGAMSLMDYEISYFSSRGPSGAWYLTHQDDWTCDLQRYGEALIKPDIVMPGGGRALKESTPDEVLYSGVTGWTDGMYDLVPNLFEGMHGTSMAAPLAAALIALALDRGSLPAGQGLAAVRAIMSRLQVKNAESGYGVMSAVQLGLA